MDFLPNRFIVSSITYRGDRQETDFFDAVKNGYADLIALYLEENPKLLFTTDSNGCAAIQSALSNMRLN